MLVYNDILNKYSYIIIILAIIYYILSKNKSAILLTIIIIIIAFYYINNYIKEGDNKIKSDTIIKEDKIRAEVKDIVELDTANFYINKNDKKAKFLIKNSEFMNILFNIRFEISLLRISWFLLMNLNGSPSLHT